MDSVASGSVSGPEPAGESTDALFLVVYDELKRVARRQLRLVHAGATISTTELVHEAFPKLARVTEPGFKGRAHLFRTAARSGAGSRIDLVRHACR